MSLINKLGKMIRWGALGLALALPVGCAVPGGKVPRENVVKTEYSHPVADLKSRATTIYPENYPSDEGYEKLREERGEKPDLEGFISTNFATGYVDRRDFISDKEGPVNGCFFVMNKKNDFLEGDNISTGVISDFSVLNGKTLEADFFLNYSFTTDVMKKIMGGYNNETYGDRISLGYEYWLNNFEGGKSQNIGTWEWFHNSRADLDFKYYFPLDQIGNSGLLSFTISKKVPVWNFGEGKLSIIPNLNLCYCHNWQANDSSFGPNGFPQTTPGVTFLFERKAFELSVGLKHQIPLLEGIKDANYASAEIGFKF
jgi:hypothetical protein